jgi:hypothetical protein
MHYSWLQLNSVSKNAVARSLKSCENVKSFFEVVRLLRDIGFQLIKRLI